MSKNDDGDGLPTLPRGGAPTANPWEVLRRYTPARIAIGRAGGSLPTCEILGFSLACAAARDAVHAQFQPVDISEELSAAGLETLEVESAAADLQSYLQRPDLGRRLCDASRTRLAAWAAGQPASDGAIVLADGLSPIAANLGGASAAAALADRLKRESFRVAPIVLVHRGRVAIADEIGELLGAEVSVIILGERPGLTSPDSLGAYLTYQPRRGRNDSERNCVSNIRPMGLTADAAAESLTALILEARRQKISGIGLQKQSSSPWPLH